MLLFDNVTLSDSGDDNMAELDVKHVGSVVLHVVYNKGTENHAHVLVQFSTNVDTQGNEIWSDWADINQVGGVDHHLIESDPFKILNTGNYRITPIAVSMREDKLRLKVWANNAGATPGTISLYVIKNKQVV